MICQCFVRIFLRFGPDLNTTTYYPGKRFTRVISCFDSYEEPPFCGRTELRSGFCFLGAPDLCELIDN